MFSYKGNTPVRKGQSVEVQLNDSEWYVGKVQTPLASQFTVKIRKNVVFCLYSDKGMTWRLI